MINFNCLLFIILVLNLPVNASPSDEGQDAPQRSHLPKFLEPLVGAQKEDPPFFKLISKSGTTIYILGAAHNHHSDILLSKHVKKEIEKISSESIFFKEHKSFYEYLVNKITDEEYETEEAYQKITPLLRDNNTVRRWKTIHKIPHLFSEEINSNHMPK